MTDILCALGIAYLWGGFFTIALTPLPGGDYWPAFWRAVRIAAGWPAVVYRKWRNGN